MFKFTWLKFITGIALTTLVYSWDSHATQGDTEVEKEVLASFQSLVHASKALDSDKYFKHFDKKKFVGLNSNGTNWNSINDLSPLILAGFGAIEEITRLTFPNVRVSVIDEQTAILVNEYIQTMMLKSGTLVTMAGGGTQVWSKYSGEWKIVSVSSSNKPQNNTP